MMPERIKQNGWGLALMLAGVLSFIIFHFQGDGDFVGWKIWPALVEEIADGGILRSKGEMIGFSGFLSLSLVVMVSPALLRWIPESRLLKYMLLAMSVLTAGVMWYFVIDEGSGSVLTDLAIAPTLTAAGLLCVRSEKAPEIPLGPIVE